MRVCSNGASAPTGLVILCYDADSAGRRAAAVGAGVLLEAGVEVAVLVLPAGMDPDDLIRESGEQAFRDLLERPTPLLEFVLADLPPDPAERRRAGLKLAPLVCSATDPLGCGRTSWRSSRGSSTSAPVKSRSMAAGSSAAGPSSQPAQRTPMPPGERELARILLDCTDAWRQKILEVVYTEYIEDSRIRRLLEDAGEIRRDRRRG